VSDAAPDAAPADDAEREERERCLRRVGTTIRDKWRIDALLGIGGMAAVYAATHKMGRRDAIKILHPEVAISKEMRARFEQEAMAVGKLGHPGTVRVLDIDTTDDGKPFLVMELLEGESLAERAARAPLAEREVVELMVRVLDVLAAAHRLGIVHRDIKLDNLYCSRDRGLLVLDFGIARMREGGQGVRTRTGAMLGTTSYMSPEQIQGRDVDGRTDLFAVGACMFRLLARRRIHDADTDVEMLIKMGTLPAPALGSVAPGVSPRLAAVVDRALAFEAAARYPDAGSMLAELRSLLDAVPSPLDAAGLAPAERATKLEGSSARPVQAELPHAVLAPTSAVSRVDAASLQHGIPAAGHVATAATAASAAPREPSALAQPASSRGLLIAVAAAALLLPLAGAWLYACGRASTGAEAAAIDEPAPESEAESGEVESGEVAESKARPAASGFLPPPVVGPAAKPAPSPAERTGKPSKKGRGPKKDKGRKDDD